MPRNGGTNLADETARPKRERRLIFRWMRMLKSEGDLRKEKVRRVRRSIKASEYENQLKLEVGIERMIQSLSEE